MASGYATSTNGATLSETVTLFLERREFDVFLQEMHGNPNDGDWKTPSKELSADEFDCSKYAQVEIFNDTLVGPITVRHLISSDVVQVEVKRPSDALWRTANDLIAEAPGKSPCTSSGANVIHFPNIARDHIAECVDVENLLDTMQHAISMAAEELRAAEQILSELKAEIDLDEMTDS